jgi:hypothetical protein
LISQRFIDETRTLLTKYCPLTLASEECTDHLWSEIEDYTEKFSHPPSPELVLRLAQPFENILKSQTEAQKTAANREAVYAKQVARIFPQEESND